MSAYKASASRGATSTMKSDGLGTANKPGDGLTAKAKNVKKPGDRSVAAKGKTGISWYNRLSMAQEVQGPNVM